MARIHSREELKQYGLRKIGAPVIKINVDDQQLEDRIDDALDLFWEYHSDGSEQIWLNYQLTEKDIQDQEIRLPDGILSITSVLSPVSGTGGGNTGIANINLQYQMFITDVMNVRKIMSGCGLSSFYITQQYLGMMQDTFSYERRLAFNKHHDRLSLLTDWSSMRAGDWIGIECYRVINPERVGEANNNRWLKNYVAALFKLQWGNNLMKFGGASLPGGVQVNASEILSEAHAEVDKLEEELHKAYQEPIDFFIG